MFYLWIWLSKFRIQLLIIKTKILPKNILYFFRWYSAKNCVTRNHAKLLHYQDNNLFCYKEQHKMHDHHVQQTWLNFCGRWMSFIICMLVNRFYVARIVPSIKTGIILKMTEHIVLMNSLYLIPCNMLL